MSYMKNDAKGILVVVLGDRDGASPAANAEALGQGRALADALGVELTAAAMGIDDVSTAAFGAANKVYQLSGDGNSFTTEGYTDVLLPLIEQGKYETVLIPATANGKELAPYLAAALDTGIAADVTDIRCEDGKWTAVRPCFGGNLFATIEFADVRPLIVTLRPKSFCPYASASKSPAMEKLAAQPAKGKKVVGFEEETGVVNLGDAQLIVSGGRGMVAPENFDLLRQLADLLGGAVGATRGAVDAGWIAYPHQVGQTGKSVRPKVYLACGISGAIQHLAGMRGSDVIIAINRDKDASIFKVASYGFICDALKLVPALISALKNR
jgi:electron transfer flavoprotein alpha subunit